MKSVLRERYKSLKDDLWALGQFMYNCRWASWITHQLGLLTWIHRNGLSAWMEWDYIVPMVCFQIKYNKMSNSSITFYWYVFVGYHESEMKVKIQVTHFTKQGHKNHTVKSDHTEWSKIQMAIYNVMLKCSILRQGKVQYNITEISHTDCSIVVLPNFWSRVLNIDKITW